MTTRRACKSYWRFQNAVSRALQPVVKAGVLMLSSVDLRLILDINLRTYDS